MNEVQAERFELRSTMWDSKSVVAWMSREGARAQPVLVRHDDDTGRVTVYSYCDNRMIPAFGLPLYSDVSTV